MICSRALPQSIKDVNFVPVGMGTFRFRGAFCLISFRCSSEGGTEAFSQNHAVRNKNSLERGLDARLFGEAVL